MKLKRVIFLILLVLILFISFNVASASEDTHTSVVESDNVSIISQDIITYDIDNDNIQNSLMPSKSNFNELNSIIKSSDEINLTNDYYYDKSSDSSFKKGIVINKSIKINGNNHIISGSNISNIFNFNNTSHINVELININFIDSKSILQFNNASVILTNCSFINSKSSIGAYVSNITINNSNFNNIDELIVFKVYKDDGEDESLREIDCNLIINNSNFINGSEIVISDSLSSIVSNCYFNNVNDTFFTDNSNISYLNNYFVNCSHVIDFSASNVIIDNNSFYNCYANVISSDQPSFSLYINNSILKNCVSELLNWDYIDKIVFNNTKVINNKNLKLHFLISNKIIFENSVFTNNKNLSFDFNIGDVDFLNLTMTNNTCDSQSFITIIDCDFNIKDCLISNNIINSKNLLAGPLILNYNTVLTSIINTNITNNIVNTPLNLGLIFNLGFLDINNSNINNNVLNSTYYFGKDSNQVIYSPNGLLHIESTNLDNNQCLATTDGNYIFINHFSFVLPNNESTAMDLPSKYDLRNIVLEDGSTVSWLTPVRSQLDAGNCWAFAATAVIESYFLRYYNVSYDFSENNLKNLMSSSGEHGWEYDANGGGIGLMAAAYWLRYSGVVYESLDPYNPHSTVSKELPAAFHVQDLVFSPLVYDDEIALLKEYIMKYGALSSGIFCDFANNPSEPNVYYPYLRIPDHDVCLVGWDDSIVIEGAPGPGAWIIKNSWGLEKNYTDENGTTTVVPSGDKGYYYISYYDRTFRGLTSNNEFSISGMGVTNIESASNYINYQYDLIDSPLTSLGLGDDYIWMANQFVSEDNNPLSAFGLYTLSLDSSYEVYIYVNGKLVHTQNGSIPEAGYHTIKLDKYIKINKGDTFKVVVKLITPGFYFPAVIETNMEYYISKSVSYPNSSYISRDGINWIDLYEKQDTLFFYNTLKTKTFNGINLCLKAYLANDTNLTISLPNMSMKYGEEVSYELVLSDKDGNRLANKEISIRIYDKYRKYNYNFTTDAEGKVILTLKGFDPSKYNVEAYYVDEEGCEYASNNSYLTVKPLDTKIVFEVTKLKNGKYLVKGQVLDSNGDLVDEGYVKITVGNKVYTVKLNNGEFSIVIKAPNKNGVYDVVVNYYISGLYSKYAPSNATIYGAITVNIHNKTIHDVISVNMSKDMCDGITMQHTAMPLLVLLFALITLPLVYRRK